MISVKEAIRLHQLLIEEHGGAKGIRDMGLLESAMNRPYATFDQQDLYPTPIEKASALLESIVINHPFMDGNKRIGYFLMRYSLLLEGLDFNATEDEKYELVISVSKGERNFSEIKSWIENKIFKLQ